MELLYIGLFGALGVFARYFIGRYVISFSSNTFPLGTFLINIVGAFAIGIIYTLSIDKWSVSPELRTGLMVGLLGGFTTFSAYCLDTIKLAEEASYQNAFLYFGLSPVIGVAFTFMGMILTKRFLN